MPKLKTNKSIKKRFKITGRKKAVGHRSKRRHLLGDRTPSHKRHLRKKWTLGGPDRETVLRSMPYDR